MNKKELNNGCIVQLKNRRKYVYLKNAKTTNYDGDVFLEIDGFGAIPLENYNNDLSHSNVEALNVIKICNSGSVDIDWSIHMSPDYKGLQWTDVKIKDLTVAEIEDEMKYKVKITKEKEKMW